MKHVKLFEQFTVNEGKLPLDKLVAMINQKYGPNPDCAEVAMFVYDNYNKVTGLNKSARNDEGYFPNEVEALIDEFGFDIDEFSDCYGRVAESVINELKLTSHGVKDLLKAINNRLDLLPQLGFDKFKDVIHYLKYGDQEEQKELQDKLKELGVNVAYESLEVNEAKVIDRDEMIKWIQQYMKFVKTTEEFDGSTGGIWVSGENMDLFKGKRIYDYYNETRAYDLGVLSSWEKELDKRGWYSEWYDAGTVMIWQN